MENVERRLFDAIKSKDDQALKELMDELAAQIEGPAGAVSKFLADLDALQLARSRTAKIMMMLLDHVTEKPDSTLEFQINLCKEAVQWCAREKRDFLRQRIELKLCNLHLAARHYQETLDLLKPLHAEVKKLDDKPLLVEILLCESCVYFQLRNFPQSKASLTSARAVSNSIYVPPALQCQLNLRAGIIQTQENDFKTSYSYFFEAFENYQSLDDPRAVLPLKYMLMCKIISGASKEVSSIYTERLRARYDGRELQGMVEIAEAHQNRSLRAFRDVLKKYEPEIESDEVLQSHLETLYRNMLESNLIRIVEPYSRVEVSHISKQIELDGETVEKKLSQMILDGLIRGTLDQENQCLILFNPVEIEETYDYAHQTISRLEKVVDELFVRASKLS